MTWEGRTRSEWRTREPDVPAVGGPSSCGSDGFIVAGVIPAAAGDFRVHVLDIETTMREMRRLFKGLSRTMIEGRHSLDEFGEALHGMLAEAPWLNRRRRKFHKLKAKGTWCRS